MPNTLRTYSSSIVELLHGIIGGVELDLLEWSCPKHPIICIVEINFYIKAYDVLVIYFFKNIRF